MKANLKEMAQKGFALPAALLLLLVMSAVAVGMIYLVHTEARVSGSDLDGTAAYYASEAGMEKMMADLSGLFINNQAPTASEIAGLGGSAPDLAGIEFSDYSVRMADADGDGSPDSEIRTVSAGPNEGLVASIIPMELSVTGRGPGGSEVRMVRDIEVALIPIFQFGNFSSTDLSYFPGPNFSFGGRVHTNGNLFLAASDGGGVVFQNKISAAGEIIRQRLSNGQSTDDAGFGGPVYIPTVANGCAESTGTDICRDLALTEGSKVDGLESSDNSDWPDISLSVYNGMIVNGRTGAKALELPFVADGENEFEIIRRAPGGEVGTSLLGRSRLYNQAQVRVLLNDEESDLPGGKGRLLSNDGEYFDGVTYGLTDTAFAAVGSSSGEPLVDGYLLVQALQGGTYVDVTSEWLDLGIARENPDAILKFQTLKYNPLTGVPDPIPVSLFNQGQNFWPINLYDTREGEVRDVSTSTSDCALGGVMNVVELDVNNLRRWLSGEIGLTGTSTATASEGGYIFYHSDRRGQLKLNGEYGFEDVVNPSSAGGSPDGQYDKAEDVNENGVLDVYGNENLGLGFGLSEGSWSDPTERVSCETAQRSRVTGARHGLKLVNGILGSLPSGPAGGGFTVSSENPVYVHGNYNALTGIDFSASTAHVPAAIIADAVTLLSSAWQDWASFDAPADPSQRPAVTTSYRMAVAAGKNISSSGWGGWDTGTDGGTHNFLRYLEDWSGTTLKYRGSLVSFFYSTQAVGVFKCCANVYSPPVREYSFDSEFIDPSRLPPGTPRFRDLVNLGYQQIFHPEDRDYIPSPIFDGEQGEVIN
ncbi:MAG TPA: PilX N-terminal domain-containing pilus assembly protein [Acidobacteriota bacterium]|nr:PilX N-terminal domain-containing pilus assembly protein [Acidobacteriota bacterium]